MDDQKKIKGVGYFLKEKKAFSIEFFRGFASLREVKKMKTKLEEKN